MTGGFFRRLLLFCIVGFGAWYAYAHFWPRYNPKIFGGRLETIVNQELTKAGITDRDVVSEVHKERGYCGINWVESRRMVRAKSTLRARAIRNALELAARRTGCSVDHAQTSSGEEVQLKKFWIVLQRITLVSHPEPEARKNIGSQEPQMIGPSVAFVIDDVASDGKPMDRFASLGVPLTFAILPRDRHCKALADKANAMNFPVMMHLPMEPLDLAHNDPGSAGLYLKMSDAELKSQFEKDFASIPHMVGINNHMGSAFTESEPKMALVLGLVKSRGVYFLDSKTSGKSVVCRVAARVGVPCLANETFLDNKDDVQEIEKQLDLVMALALKRGRTIAIGHYRRKYLVQALAKKLPEFKSHGVTVVPLPVFYHK